MNEPDCRGCGCPASWHLLSAMSSMAIKRAGSNRQVKRGRCVVRKRNERGFPTPCGCREYRAPVRVTA